MEYNNQPKPLLDIRKDKRRMRELGIGTNALKAIRYTRNSIPEVDQPQEDIAMTEEEK